MKTLQLHIAPTIVAISLIADRLPSGRACFLLGLTE